MVTNKKSRTAGFFILFIPYHPPRRYNSSGLGSESSSSQRDLHKSFLFCLFHFVIGESSFGTNDN
jgi:hypothetical protein